MKLYAEVLYGVGFRLTCMQCEGMRDGGKKR
jgi:hypothetical protein